MKKKDQDKTMQVEILGDKKGNTGVMIGGEITRPGDVVTVPLALGRNLIYRERAAQVEASAKASAKASTK